MRILLYGVVVINCSVICVMTCLGQSDGVGLQVKEQAIHPEPKAGPTLGQRLCHWTSIDTALFSVCSEAYYYMNS